MWRIAIAFLIGVGCTFYFLRESQRPNPSQRGIPSVAEEPKVKAMQPTGATIPLNDPVAPAPPAQTAVVLQPLKIKIPYGETVIPAGTSLPIVWQDATRVGVKYLDQVQAIPLSGVRLVTIAIASSPSIGATPPKQADEVARARISQAAITTTFNVSSLSLDAHERATADGTQTRWLTTYGSYHRDYRRQKKIILIVHDLSRHAPPVTAHVYFVARQAKDDRRFIYNAKEVPIELHGQLEATAETEMPTLDASETYKSFTNARYVNGADIDGWIVVGEVSGKTFGIKASGPALLDVAQHRDILDKMVAESGISTRLK
jgi:hypothetical protein